MLTCCSARDGGPLRLQATVAFPPRDTVRFALAATSHQCFSDRSVLLEAVSPQGYGVLMHLHYRDSLTPESYPIAAPGDSNTVPRSTVAVRYLVREVTHGFPIDSGAVRVERSGHAVSAHIAGSGLENAIRTPAWIDFREVPLSGDTVPCHYQP